MEIKTTVEIDLNNNAAGKKDFMVSEIYDDFDSQFELNKYEKKIMGIMTERLSEKIIIYLRTLKQKMIIKNFELKNHKIDIKEKQVDIINEYFHSAIDKNQKIILNLIFEYPKILIFIHTNLN